MKQTLRNSLFSCQQMLQHRAVVAKMNVALVALLAGVGSLQAQTPGPVLIVAPADGTYAWTSGTKTSHQLNVAGDSIYFLTAASDLTSFAAFDAGVSTTAACAPAERRVQTNAFELVLATNDINTMSILGTSSGSSDRTLRAIYVNGTEVPAASYTIVSSQTGGNAACGNISVVGLNIPAHARVIVVIGSTPSSTPQNFRVNVIYINESALPFKLIDFKAQKQLNQRLLTWVVADGNDPATYTVERSQDGNTFSAIGDVKSNGNATLTFVDQSSISGNMVYYRLKITEASGHISYSKISALSIGNTSALQLTPNPVKGGNIYLTFSPGDHSSTVKIINMAGQVLESRMLPAQSEQANLETTNLKPGVYFVQLINGQNIQTKRFVKQ